MRFRGIFGFYAKSPFALLQKHGEHVLTAASHVGDMMRAFVAGDEHELVRIQDAVTEAEHAADAAKNELRNSLPRGIFLAVDRRDVLHYLSAQDAIADLSQDLARLLTFRPIAVPEDLGKQLIELAERAVETTQAYSTIVDTFGELVEASFKGPAASDILSTIDSVGSAESRTDRVQERAAHVLFSKDFPGDPVDVFLLSKIIDRTGGIADTAERTANRLRVMLSL